MARSNKLALALLLTTSPFPAFAQSTAPVSVLPSIVISASQFPLQADRVGASATVLLGDKLRANGIATVTEALRTVPGLSFAQSGTRGSLTSVFMRGADPRNLLVQIDPATERFVNDKEADALLTRQYRKPFVVPEKV